MPHTDDPFVLQVGQELIDLVGQLDVIYDKLHALATAAHLEEQPLLDADIEDAADYIGNAIESAITGIGRVFVLHAERRAAA